VAEPGFVRAARRQAFWHSTGVRTVLLTLALLLCVALGLQIALQERNRLAAVQPALLPGLQRLCALASCEITPYQDISALVIDSAGLSKTGQGGGDIYVLSVAIHNRAPMALAMPALELTLTDSQERPILRRVLLPAELGAPSQIPAQGQWSGQWPVQLTGAALGLTGYRMVSFYP